MRTYLLALFGCAVLAGCSSTTLEPVTTTHRLVNAEPSAERLIEKFLGALAAKDPDALHRLRVTEAEYREILLPGNVPEGQPLKRPSKELADFAWGRLDTRSLYYEQSLLRGYGGRQLAVKAVEYEDGEKRFANHTAYRHLRLTLEDRATAGELTLTTGSIVEVAGTFKFASYISD